MEIVLQAMPKITWDYRYQKEGLTPKYPKIQLPVLINYLSLINSFRCRQYFKWCVPEPVRARLSGSPDVKLLLLWLQQEANATRKHSADVAGSNTLQAREDHVNGKKPGWLGGRSFGALSLFWLKHSRQKCLPAPRKVLVQTWWQVAAWRLSASPAWGSWSERRLDRVTSCPLDSSAASSQFPLRQSKNPMLLGKRSQY